MKTKQKLPIFVKLIYNLNKNNQGYAYLVNRYGRKLDIEINSFELRNDIETSHIIGFGVIDNIIAAREITFTGTIKINKKNKNQVKYIIKGK